MKKSLLILTTLAAPFAFGQTTGGIGGGFYTEGVDYAGFTLMQRGDNPDAIVQYEVQAEGVDSVFTTGETLRLVTQGANVLGNSFSARLPEPVTLAEGETITLSFKFRYVPPLLFGTDNQDIYLVRGGLFYDTDGGDLIAAYKAEDAAWAGYYGLIWTDVNSITGDYDPPRTHLLRSVLPGAAGGPLNKGTNFEDSSSATPYIPDADPIFYTFSVTKTAEGIVLTNEMGEVSAGTPSVSLTTTDTSSLDAVDTFDTFALTLQGFLEVIISDFKVEYSGASADWNGYAIDENGWVNSGEWLGMLYVEHAPWVYSDDLASYIYVSDESGWVFVPQAN